MEVIAEMKAHKQVPYSTHLSAVMRMFANYKRGDEALALYHYFTGGLLQVPSSRLIAETMRALGAAGMLNEGLAVFGDLPRYNLRVSAPCLGARILLLALTGDMRGALEELPKLRSAAAGTVSEDGRQVLPPRLALTDLELLINSCGRDADLLRALVSAALAHLSLNADACLRLLRVCYLIILVLNINLFHTQAFKELHLTKESFALVKKMVARHSKPHE